MQTTLLGLAIALILALVTALVGPLLIDWGTYRSLLEREATRMVGAEVHVTGAISARFLPAPRLELDGVTIGQGAAAIRAEALNVEFALGPLLRGEWRATELRVLGPTLDLTLDSQGELRLPEVSPSFNPDALAVERLSIEGGNITLADSASGATMVLTGVWFNGDARSLKGPFKGEGAVTLDGALYPYRLSTGRIGEDNALKVHLNIDPVDRPMAFEADGMLGFTAGSPRFEGMLSFAQPIGLGLRGTVGAGRTTPPWRIGAKVKATAQSALFENFEFAYGADDTALKLNGVADFAFGKNPLFNGVLSGGQLDLDRIFTAPDGTRQPPAASLRQLAELTGGAFKPSFPVRLGIGVDQVTLGGNTVQHVRGDLSSNDTGWTLDRFEFRAPGFTNVKLSGGLAVDAGSVSFTGPAEIDSSDPKLLAAWLEGRVDSGQSDRLPLRLRGDLTLASDRIAIDKLTAGFGGKTLGGRIDYRFAAGPRPASLDATLNAPDFDLDAALGFGKALLAGSKAERPRTISIAADIGRATLSGFSARDVSARVKIDGEGVQIEKLSIANLGSGAFSASGRIVTGASPRGAMQVDLDAPDVMPVLALIRKFAPESAALLEARAQVLSPAKLHGQFTLDGDAPATQGKLSLDGNLGRVKLALGAQGHVDLATSSAGDMTFDGKADSDDGKALMAMLGLNGLVAVDAGKAAFSFKAQGASRGEMRLNAQIDANGLSASLDGTARMAAEPLTAALQVRVARADLSPLRADGRAPLPVTYSGRLSITGNEIAINDSTATVAGSAVRGKLALTLGDPYALKGEIDADSIEAPAFVAALIGMSPAPATRAAWAWSNEPFESKAFDLFAGQIALKVRRLALSPQLTARELRATVRLGDDRIGIEDITGDVDGGRINGSLAFQDSDDGLKAEGKLTLGNVDAASVLAAGARPPVNGKLTISTEFNGMGLSPVALIGSLKGGGTVALAEGQVSGLNPRVFDSVIRAADGGVPVDGVRIGDVTRRALDSGDFPVVHAQGAFTISAGQARFARVNIEAGDALLAMSGNLDLTDGALDARLVMTGTQEAAGARPDIFMAVRGPTTSATRSIDVSALTGWLTLRSVDNQSKKIQAIEKTQQEKTQQAVPQPTPLPQPAPSLVPPQAPLLPPPMNITPQPRPRASQSTVNPQN